MIGINSIGSNPIGIYIDLYQISTTGFSNTNSFGNSYAFSSGGLYMYLRGTTQSIFQIGKSGPNIKNNSNVVEIRNSADSGYNDIKSAGVLLSNGTSSAPAIRFSDDTDTGIYSSSSNTISFSTGGIVAAKIDTIADGTNYLTFVPGTSSTKPLITNNGSVTSGEEALGIEIRSGSAASAGKGGTILLAAGDSTDGAGGDVYLRAGGGSETGNDGGTVYIDSGSADVSSDYGGIQLRIVTTPALTISNTLNSSFAGTVTGVGSLIVNGTSASGADIKLYEDTDNGTNYVAFKAPASISTDVTWTLPNADGTENQVLKTNGSGTLSWTTITSGASITNDTTTNSTYYPTLSSTTSGTLSTAYVSNTKLTFNPSTGNLATGGTLTGVGSVIVNGTSTSSADIKLYEDTDNGTNYVALKAPESVSTSVTWTLPSEDGVENQMLVTNGNGELSWFSAPEPAVTSISNDTTTNMTYYPLLHPDTSGDLNIIYTSSTKLSFNPSTGNLAAGGTLTGVGSLIVSGTSASGADIKLYEDTDNGTNYVAFKAPASIVSDVTWTLPNADGSENQVLSTNGSGTLSWSTISGGATLSNDTTTNATYYPTLSSTTTGTYSTAYVSSTKFYFNPSTGRVSSTEFQTLSDSTKKENITNIDNALGIINNVNGVRFNWIDTKEPSLGLIAQEIEKYLPEIVDSSSSDTKTINYNGMIGVLVEAIKDLTSQLNDLKDQVKCLAS